MNTILLKIHLYTIYTFKFHVGQLNRSEDRAACVCPFLAVHFWKLCLSISGSVFLILFLFTLILIFFCLRVLSRTSCISRFMNWFTPKTGRSCNASSCGTHSCPRSPRGSPYKSVSCKTIAIYWRGASPSAFGVYSTTRQGF